MAWACAPLFLVTACVLCAFGQFLALGLKDQNIWLLHEIGAAYVNLTTFFTGTLVTLAIGALVVVLLIRALLRIITNQASAAIAAGIAGLPLPGWLQAGLTFVLTASVNAEIRQVYRRLTGY